MLATFSKWSRRTGGLAMNKIVVGGPNRNRYAELAARLIDVADANPDRRMTLLASDETNARLDAKFKIYLWPNIELVSLKR